MPGEGFLGVLGGMGPAATADFLLRLARLAPARRDQDHLPYVVYSDPRTPDRSDAILGQGPDPLPAMRQGIEFLNRAGCALIAIPCNTAHYWYDELAAASAAPVLHIVDTTAQRLRQRDGVTTVGVLATDGTLRSGIYHHRLRAAGLTVLDLAEQGEHNPAMQGIRLVKAGDQPAAQAALHTAAAQLVRRGAQALVIGCTDISAALAGADTLAGVPAIDAADCLAAACLTTTLAGHVDSG